MEGNFKTQTGTPTTGAQDVVVRESGGHWGDGDV